MIVLGLETSCDETGAALYDSDKGLLAHALHSQIDIHAEYGGVVPELASRDHIRKCIPMIESVLQQASLSKQDIDAVAYTGGPGLQGALLVGAAVGRSLAFGLNIPALAVHHMEGHLLAPMLEKNAPQFPFLALLVSGGHTQLVDVKGLGDYTLLGNHSMMRLARLLIKQQNYWVCPIPVVQNWHGLQSREQSASLNFLAR